MPWQQVVERYAIRTREYADAVARLGRVGQSGAELLPLIEDIKTKYAPCGAAGDDLDQYIRQEANRMVQLPTEKKRKSRFVIREDKTHSWQVVEVATTLKFN